MEKPSETPVKHATTPIPLDHDPWVAIPTGADLENWGRNDEIRYNQNLRYGERWRFFALTFDFLKENGISGDYWEFGCHRCRTFRMALTEARRRSLDETRFVAFDSFAGLPDEQTEHGVTPWAAGALCTSEEEFLDTVCRHGVYVDRVQTVKGFYQNSLTATLRDRFLEEGRRAALINVDCDLYESAVPVFDFIEPFIQPGTVLYIDDFFAGYKGSPEMGVSRVFTDFQKKSRFRFIEHLQVGWAGRSFIAYE